jgi:hypothetical protein
VRAGRLHHREPAGPAATTPRGWRWSRTSWPG